MPITGIDHVMLAVADLPSAVADLESALGLKSVRGGVHPDFGTANKVVHLPGLYLEMITVQEPLVANGMSVGRRIAGVNDAGGGWLAFVLAAKDLPGTVHELTAEGLPIDPPIGGHAVRHDGVVRGFWIAGYGEQFELGRLPSVIEYTHPPQADEHPTDIGYTVRGLARVDVAVNDLTNGVSRYSALLGSLPSAQGVDTVLDVPTATFDLPDGRTVRLLGTGTAVHEGLFGVALAVADLDDAVAAATARGVALSTTGIDGEVLLDSSRTLNARIAFIAEAK